MSTYDQLVAGAQTPSVNTDSLPEFKFVNPGDEVFGPVLRTQFGFDTKYGEGNLIDVRDHRFGPVTVWLSNVQLKSAFVDGNNHLLRPVQVGDIVFVRYDSTTPLEGGKTVKNFSVNLQPGLAQAAQQAQPVQPPQPAQPQPAPQQAAPQQAYNYAPPPPLPTPPAQGRPGQAPY